MGTLLLLLNALQLAKFASVFTAVGSILLSIWGYALLYGWSFAAGFVALIFAHEMGHYIAAKQKGLNPGLPNFVPFVGAFVTMKDGMRDAETEAYVAYAGPFVGSLAAFACYYWGRENSDDFYIALAQSGFLLNLFNLIPISPLDGGRITAIISPRIWFIGAPLLIAAWFYQPSPILILLAILAVPQLIKAFQHDSKTEENAVYYNTPDVVKCEYFILYLGLAIVLALMVHGT